jgi:hypothetical protein
MKGLREAKQFLPNNIYKAIDDFRNSAWTTTLLGVDVKDRYADLKQASADRCPRLLGTIVKLAEVQFRHEIYNSFSGSSSISLPGPRLRVDTRDLWRMLLPSAR